MSSWCSLRTATLILSSFGAIGNFYAAAKLFSIWFSFRWTWESESEWEGYAWRIDAARALGAIVCAYFFVAAIACVVGLIGVCKRIQANLRLFRDYSIADLAFGFTCTTLFAFASTQTTIRSMLCEELSRQPDLLRHLSAGAGVTVENCESFFDKAIVGVIMVLFVVLFIRLQFTLTVLNYYTHLRRTQQSQNSHQLHGRSSHTRSHSSSQRILVLPMPIPSSSSPSSSNKEDTSAQDTLIYAPVQVTAAQARAMDARAAYISVSRASSRPSSPRRSSTITISRRDLETDLEASGTGAIRLPVVEGEAPWSTPKPPHYRDEKV